MGQPVLPATAEEIDRWRDQFQGMRPHVARMPAAQKLMYAYVVRMFATISKLARELASSRAECDVLRDRVVALEDELAAWSQVANRPEALDLESALAAESPGLTEQTLAWSEVSGESRGVIAVLGETSGDEPDVGHSATAGGGAGRGAPSARPTTRSAAHHPAVAPAGWNVRALPRSPATTRSPDPGHRDAGSVQSRPPNAKS